MSNIIVNKNIYVLCKYMLQAKYFSNQGQNNQIFTVMCWHLVVKVGISRASLTGCDVRF